MPNIKKKSHDPDGEYFGGYMSEDDPDYNPVRKRRKDSSEEDSDVDVIWFTSTKSKRNSGQKPSNRKRKRHSTTKEGNEQKPAKTSSKGHDKKYVSQTSKLQEASTSATCSDTTIQRGTKKENQICKINIHEENNDSNLWGKFLPDTALEIIFKRLVEEEGSVPLLFRMGQVCRTWRNASKNSSLWHTADFSGSKFNKRYKNTKVLTWLCEHRLTGVRNLNFGDWIGINTQEALDAICTFCTNLQNLSLSGWYDLKPAHIFEIVGRCANLTALDVSNICEQDRCNPVISVKSINVLTSLMGDRLTSLNFSNNRVPNTVSSLLNAISANAPNLEVLDLSNVRASNSNFPIVKLQEKCQKLRVLRLTNTSVHIAVPKAHQLKSGIGFPHLEELSLASGSFHMYFNDIISYVNNETIYGILHESYNLRLLDIRGSSVTEFGILNIPANNLEYIYLSCSKAVRQSDSNLKDVLEKWCHSLIYVDLSWTVSSLSLKQAFEVFSDSGRIYPLKYLDLVGTTVELSTVQKVVKNCPNLTSLNLSSCRSMGRGLKRHYRTREEIFSLLEVTDESVDFL